MIELGLHRPGPVEHRQGGPHGYGDLLVAGLLAQATGDVSRHSDELAVLEACRGKWRRALGAVTVEPERARQVLTRRNLMLIGEGLLSRDGAFVGLLSVDPMNGRMVLEPCGQWTVWGRSPEPSTWTYPTGTLSSRYAVRDEVLHVQWSAHPRWPHLNRGPWARCSTTSTPGGRLEQSLAREHNSPVGSVVPAPENDQATDDGKGGLLDSLMTLRGGLALVPTFAGGLGLGQHAAPQRDWRTTRIGPAPTRETVDLRTQVHADLADAAGVPAVLLRAGRRWDVTSRSLPPVHARIGPADPRSDRGSRHRAAGSRRQARASPRPKRRPSCPAPGDACIASRRHVTDSHRFIACVQAAPSAASRRASQTRGAKSAYVARGLPYALVGDADGTAAREGR